MHPRQDTLFNQICALAETENKYQLIALLTQAQVCIDVQCGLITSISLLAQLGETAAVNFLINQFQASLNYAVQGYAQGRHTAAANSLIAQGADQNYAVHGYALGGHTAAVNSLIAQGADRNYAVLGYAQGGHTAAVNSLIAQGADQNRAVRGYAQGRQTAAVNSLIAQGADRNYAVLGYALSGHTVAVNSLIAQGADQNSAVRGYAQGGHTAAVNSLITQGTDRDEAVRGYALGGHTAAVNSLIAQGADRNYAVLGYALGGHTAAVNSLITQWANRNYAVQGYAQGRQTAAVNSLIAQGADQDDAVLGYALGGHTAAVNSLIAQGADRDEAVRGYAQGRHTAAVNSLIAQGANRNYAVQGYALGGHTAAVNSLIAQGANRNYAVRRYAQGGHTAAVNSLIAQGAARDEAVQGYMLSRKLETKKGLTTLLLMTNDRTLILQLNEKAPTAERLSSQNLQALFRAKKRMHVDAMDYPTARKWGRAWRPDIQTWLWHGGQLMSQKKIDVPVLLTIASFVTGVNDVDTINMLARHIQRPPVDSFRMGKHGLFQREALLTTNLAPSELVISKQDLQACLRVYQPTGIKKFFGVSNTTMNKLTALANSSQERFTYTNILHVIGNERKQLDYPKETGTKQVMRALNTHFDAALQAALQPAYPKKGNC